MLYNNEIKNNIHHNEQSFFKADKINIEYFKMEKLNDNIEYLNEKYGLYFKNTFTSQHHVVKSNNNCNYIGNINYSQIDSIPHDYSKFYNITTKNKVEYIYKDDLFNFNYTWDDFINI